MNPIRFAAGVEDAGDEPLLVEFTVVECIGAGAENSRAPAVKVGMKSEFRSLVGVALLVRAGFGSWSVVRPASHEAGYQRRVVVLC